MTNLLNSEIEFSLSNNKDVQRVRENIRIIDRAKLQYVQDTIKTWLEYESSNYFKPNYCDTLTLHCIKGAEYIVFTVTVFRFGSLFNLGWVRLNILCSSRGGFEKRKAIKFKYRLDDDDKETILSVITGILNIMVNIDFDSCDNSIDVLFPSTDLPKQD